jgi:hypothetical protein
MKPRHYDGRLLPEELNELELELNAKNDSMATGRYVVEGKLAYYDIRVGLFKIKVYLIARKSELAGESDDRS